MIAGGLFLEKCQQMLTDFSTMETEYVAYYETTCQALWLQNYILGLGIMNTIMKS